MPEAVFTIVAKNYIGLARVLEKSVLKNGGADFFIFVADELNDAAAEKLPLPGNIIAAKEKLNIDEQQWQQMAFKYNLIEFCTAIKPFCIEYLFNPGPYTKVIYLDPDVYVFNTLEKLWSCLDTHSIVVTPHIVDIHPRYASDHPQYLFLINGTFNLGFIAMKNSSFSRDMLAWWKKQLTNECFFDNERGTATDQKWINLLPAFFGEDVLHINRDRGLNVAPWNYHERKIVYENDTFFVTNRDDHSAAGKTLLTFIHFSGYDYRSFSENKVVHKGEDLNEFKDFEKVFEKYAAALAESDFNMYSNLKYSYHFFNNGKNIMGLHRRLYRRLLVENQEYLSPFGTGKGSFYDLLRKKKLLDHSAMQADKITGKTITGFDKKLGKVNLLARCLKGMVGIRRYSMIVRFLRRYFREENQVFLIHKDIGKKLW